ncbi:hydroxymethylbilane synthase [Clostridiales bacterium PH28_bin88]|nr:hydroxymethylbilane synthase [Clostridiales bacterium PH28_bin88]
MVRELVIGTRDSALALWQTNWVLNELQRMHPEITFRVLPLKTKGDKILDVALAKIGDKGLFTKELEMAMLDKSIDMAVHSMKDLPTVLPEGLIIGAICRREDPADVLISSKGYTLDTLPAGARVGTSSLRRKAQLLQFRPDLLLADLRGNLNTRMAKLDRGDYDAVVLAKAGVLRMGWSDRITQTIPYDVCLPAVGQGSIGIEIRQGDDETAAVVKVLNSPEASDAITAERALLRELEGGCQIPIGAMGSTIGEEMRLEGLVASLDGLQVLRRAAHGPRREAVNLGKELARQLKYMGAEAILRQVRRETDAQ